MVPKRLPVGEQNPGLTASSAALAKAGRRR
jgi:hypothetical protein